MGYIFGQPSDDTQPDFSNMPSLGVQGTMAPIAPAPKVPKPGHNWLAILGDALAAASGGKPVYLDHLMRQRELEQQGKAHLAQLMAQAQIQEQTYQRHRGDQMTDWQAQHQWSLDHQGPTNDERVAVAAGYKPGTPEFQGFIKSMHDPVVTLQQTDGNGGATTSYVPRSVLLHGGVPGSATSSPPDVLDTLPPGAKPIGGAAPSNGPGTFPSVTKAQIGVESSGRRGIAGPQTPYGQAFGLMQVQDGTGQEMARKLGVAWRPDLMRGTSDAAAQYQTAIGQAYYNEGLRRYGGDQRKALMYYHGGPNERLWGPKTRAYADTVMARMGG